MRPLIPASSSWEWRLASAADLFGADVNARLVSAGPDGATLTRQGVRPISLISPALQWNDDLGSTLVIRAQGLSQSPGEEGEALVRLLWQESPTAAYRFVEQRARLGAGLSEIVFSLPVEPAAIHRVGVQFPDVRGEVGIQSMELPSLNPVQLASAFARQLWTSEPLANHSVNFLRGPMALAHGLNYYLSGAAILSAGLFMLTRRGASRTSAVWFCVAAFMTMAIAADALSAAGLWRQQIAETRLLAGKPRLDQIDAMNGPDIGWAYRAMIELTPPGSSFAVFSDDPFTPAHRLGYLLAPHRTRVEDPRKADYLLIIRDSRAMFSPGSGEFQFDREGSLRAELLAEAEGLQLLRRLAE